MKKLIFNFLIIFSSISSFCQSSTVIKVNNALEFVEAIGSNKTIELEGNTIFLSDISSSKSGSNYRFDEEFDGHELVIFNVSNLKIIGLGLKPVKIITKPVYGDVLVFNNCSDVLLENIDAGHGPEKGECTGGVLNFSDSKNISIKNSVLFGSGIEGITAEKVKNLNCDNTIIKGCSFSIMTLKNCEKIKFNNCEFIDNKEFDLINLSDCLDLTFAQCKISENSSSSILRITNCLNILFTECIIENNKGYCDSEHNKLKYETLQNQVSQNVESFCLPCVELGEYEDDYLFNIDKSVVYINNCSINNNTSCYFSKDTKSFELKNCSFNENQFILGYFAN